MNHDSGVRADTVAFRYPQNDIGLPPTSLQIDPGQVMLVAGPSGSGKSTLARCLTGIIPHLYRGVFSGTVCLNGLVTTDAPMWRVAEQAGMVFQNPAAQTLTISVEEEIIFGLENLGLPEDDVRERLEQSLERFGLLHLRNRDPRSLSGGEQQKLALAAVVARRPAVLGLDEPFSMLDSTAALEFARFVGELAGNGTAVVICEHREEYVQGLSGLRTLRLNGEVPQRLSASPGRDLSAVQGNAVEAFTLEIRELGVELDGRLILRDLSAEFPGGQVVAIVGRNGVGKTTLLRAIAGLQAARGQILIMGSRPSFGMVFQNADTQLFNASVREEILYRVTEPDMRLYAWLIESLGLVRYEETPPLLLSEGEKKRVALATVLMRSPYHGVLLDEPALGQDAAHKAILMDVAHQLAQAGRLVMMTTHDLHLAAQADRLLILGADGFVADGPPEQVLHDPESWRRVGLTLPRWILEMDHRRSWGRLSARGRPVTSGIPVSAYEGT